ncbi:hypothetical protein PUR28_12855 [Streptomyces sp. BE308]|uniref:hypothetical protein n=1 Tax=Streptomyces sp. BE308 TaxID=3002529 RepID=UPI002E79DB7C|nr:hypothetical protein [Streptomyces sp. BE308]MEE1791646.1 hypothetical protein [Streptomyces sp. BE308]
MTPRRIAAGSPCPCCSPRSRPGHWPSCSPWPAVAHRIARREQAVLALVVLVSAVLTVAPDPHWLSTR